MEGAAQGGMTVCEQDLAFKVLKASSKEKDQATDPGDITASLKPFHERAHSDPFSARSSFVSTLND